MGIVHLRTTFTLLIPSLFPTFFSVMTSVFVRFVLLAAGSSSASPSAAAAPSARGLFAELAAVAVGPSSASPSAAAAPTAQGLFAELAIAEVPSSASPSTAAARGSFAEPAVDSETAAYALKLSPLHFDSFESYRCSSSKQQRSERRTVQKGLYCQDHNDRNGLNYPSTCIPRLRVPRRKRSQCPPRLWHRRRPYCSHCNHPTQCTTCRNPCSCSRNCLHPRKCRCGTHNGLASYKSTPTVLGCDSSSMPRYCGCCWDGPGSDYPSPSICIHPRLYRSR